MATETMFKRSQKWGFLASESSSFLHGADLARWALLRYLCIQIRIILCPMNSISRVMVSPLRFVLTPCRFLLIPHEKYMINE